MQPVKHGLRPSRFAPILLLAFIANTPSWAQSAGSGSAASEPVFGRYCSEWVITVSCG
jgi:hypothetical protein